MLNVKNNKNNKREQIVSGGVFFFGFSFLYSTLQSGLEGKKCVSKKKKKKTIKE
jgi:hypothetical protein